MNKTVTNLLTQETVQIDYGLEAAEDILTKRPIVQFDTDHDDVIWFYFEDIVQLVAIVSFTECILKAGWSGPGWYRTELIREFDSNWLELYMKCPHSELEHDKLINEIDLERLRSIKLPQ